MHIRIFPAIKINMSTTSNRDDSTSGQPQDKEIPAAPTPPPLLRNRLSPRDSPHSELGEQFSADADPQIGRRRQSLSEEELY